MKRVDLAATIARIDFPDEIWGWIDILGEAIRVTELEALQREKAFVADTPFKKVLRGSVHAHLNGLKAAYTLIRMELVGQAAGQARLLCEGVITLRYVAERPDERAVQFLEYSAIEAFEAADALITWDEATADPALAGPVRAMRDSLRPEFERLRPQYQYLDRKKKLRRFSNWANRTIAEMSSVNPTTERLYELIYRQLSSYLHGSAWSFRHQPAYTAAYYDPNIVLADIGQVTLGTLGVWEAAMESCDQLLRWEMAPKVAEVLSAVRAQSRIVAVGRSISDAPEDPL